jgi:hypothetical protein
MLEQPVGMALYEYRNGQIGPLSVQLGERLGLLAASLGGDLHCVEFAKGECNEVEMLCPGCVVCLTSTCDGFTCSKPAVISTCTLGQCA